jgi:D-alanyl-D-alanine carboxypeptidase
MFLKAGDRVSVRDLSRGLIVDSGNDACVALADYVAGGQPQFVALMNEYVEKLHLQDTHLKPSTAWTRRASTVRPMIWRCCRGRLFTASLTSTTCTARKA